MHFIYIPYLSIWCIMPFIVSSCPFVSMHLSHRTISFSITYSSLLHTLSNPWSIPNAHEYKSIIVSETLSSSLVYRTLHILFTMNPINGISSSGVLFDNAITSPSLIYNSLSILNTMLGSLDYMHSSSAFLYWNFYSSCS